MKLSDIPITWKGKKWKRFLEEVVSDISERRNYTPLERLKLQNRFQQEKNRFDERTETRG